MRLPASKDTRLLVAGVVAFFALVTYLGVAFADTHASSGGTATSFGAPWVPKYHSSLAAVPRGKTGVGVFVARGWTGQYGAVVPTLVSQPPPGRRVVVGLWLRGPGRAGFEVVVDEFPAGPDIVNTTVPATRTWHHYVFRARIKGRWLGLGMFVGRPTSVRGSRWFAVRDLSVTLRTH